MGGWGADELRWEADRLRRAADRLRWSFVAVIEHSRPATFVAGPLADRLTRLLSEADLDLCAAVDELRQAADGFDRRAAIAEALEPGR